MHDDTDAPRGPSPDGEDLLFYARPPVVPDQDPADRQAGGDRDPTRGADWPQATAPATPTAPAGRASRGSFLRELPVLLLVAFVLAFLLRTFVLQVFYIPSGSMEPTLAVNDRMAVEKLTYRFREPIRGEIVVFEGETFDDGHADDNLAQRVVRGAGQFLGVVPMSARDFVKRVIGLPGDEIVVVEGRVYVNGELLDEPYVVFEDPTDFGPVTVPEGALFFLGDNRPNSSDSRRSLGFVDREQVVGRALVVIWPFSHVGMLTDVEHDVPDADPVEEPAEDPAEDSADAAPLRRAS